MATFVLIPGAGGLAWEWHRLGPELEARGHVAVPIDLPAGDDGSGLAEYADWTAASIRGRTDVVLVAQSFGGFTAPLVCERASVGLIVLLNAMIPKPGETFGAWWSNTGQGEAMREQAATLGLDPRDLEDDRVALLPRRPGRGAGGGAAARSAAVRHAARSAVATRTVARRPDARPVRPRRPPLPRGVPAARCAGTARDHAGHRSRRAHGRAQQSSRARRLARPLRGHGPQAGVAGFAGGVGGASGLSLTNVGLSSTTWRFRRRARFSTSTNTENAIAK